MKKFLILFSVLISFSVASDFEIPIDKAKDVTVNELKKEVKENNVNQNSEKASDSKIKKETNDLFSDVTDNKKSVSPLTSINNKYEGTTNKIQLKNYVGVAYNKNLEWFSILGHNEQTFERIKEKYHITPFLEKRYLNSTSPARAVLYNAFLYDYKYKKPNIAENFYILFPKKVLNNHRFSFLDRKLRFADYLIRTGRPLAIFNYLNKVECMANIKWMGLCMYYLGVAEYFRTGDNKNNYLMVAKSYVRKARLLYDMKK